MQVISLGLIDTATSAVQLTTDTSIRAHQIIIDPVAPNGWVAFGLSDVAAGGTGVIFHWAQNEVIVKSLPNGSHPGGNELRVSDYYILAANTNDGAHVSYVVR